MAAQMSTLTTGAADSVEPPWPSRRAHLCLVPGLSASLAPDSRSRAVVMWPQLLWLRAKQMLRWWMIVLLNLSTSTSIKEPPLLLIMCHHLDRLISYKKKCTNLPYAMCLTVPSTASAFTFVFSSRRPCPPTSAFAVYRSLE